MKKMKVAELKAALQARGLADDGKKGVLAARLEAAIKKEADDAFAATPTPARQPSAASASSAAAAAGAGSGASPRMVGRAGGEEAAAAAVRGEPARTRRVGHRRHRR